MITPANDLPAITSPLEIDGYTQSGASPASSTAWAQPGVLIDAVNTTRALEITTDASVIRGLAIHDSSGAAGGPDGIEITGNEEPHRGNHIGTDRTSITMASRTSRPASISRVSATRSAAAVLRTPT